MKAPLSVDEYDLVGFFGCLPKQEESDVPWQYNDSAYEVADSVLHLSFAIAPAYRDVRLLITVASTIVFELTAMGVEDVRVSSEKGRTSLEVTVTPTHSIWLSLKPQIMLRQSVSGEVAK